jgi:hypothetical protein
MLKSSLKMRRGFQVTFSLLAVFALVRPFDCFAASPRRHEAVNCCLKGKCVPKASSDECCKNAVPEGQLAPKSTHDRPALDALALIVVLSQDPRALTGLSEPVKHPPPRFHLITASLPLLI